MSDILRKLEEVSSKTPVDDGLDELEAMIKQEEAELTPEQAEELAAEPDLARIAQILSTGALTSQIESITSRIPPDRHGCFVRERDGDIFKYTNLGYRIETTDTLPGAKGLHNAGDKRIRVGDVILMTTSKRNVENIKKAEAMQLRAKLLIGEQEYDKNARTNPDVPTFNESATYVAQR